MKKMILFVAASILILSCKTTGYQKISANVSDPMQDFNILSVPREKIPIGSEWIQGIGPTNSTVTDLEITNKKSLSQYSLSQEFKTRLNLALFNFLGIDGNYQKQIDININKMSVVRPNKLIDLKMIPGKSYLFEGILVEEFSLDFDKSIGLDIEAVWESKTGEIDVSTTTGSNKKVNVKASNVYLGYRVITVEKVSREKKITQQVKNSENINYSWNFKDYHIDYNKNRLVSCFLNKKEENPYVNMSENAIYQSRMMEEFGECLTNNPVLFKISSENIYDEKTGKLYESTLSFPESSFQFYISEVEINNKRLELNNSILNNEIIQDFLIIDSFKLHPVPSYPDRHKNPLNFYNELRVNEKSAMSFFRNKIQITNLKNAVASGW